MRLDQTHVRVRERNVLEILDLTFQIIRAYWRPFFILSMLGALPFACINHWLTAWLLDEGQGGSELPISFMWHQTLLVFIEAPLGSLLLTTYLGHAVFDETPGFWKIVRDTSEEVEKFSGRSWFLGVWRYYCSSCSLPN